MSVNSIQKKNHTIHQEVLAVAENDAHMQVEKLFEQCAKMQHPTVDEVNELIRGAKVIEDEISKKITGCGKPFVRLFSRIGMFSEYFKILRLKRQINGLRLQAEKTKELGVIDRMINQMNRRGFITTLDESAILETFESLKPCLKSIDCQNAFIFRITSQEEGQLEFYLLSESGYEKSRICLKKHLGKITVLGLLPSQYDTIDSFVAAHATGAICVSQLQEVSLWFDRHGVTCELQSPIIEQKLTKLLNSCPQGAYILYPGAKGTIQLSRLLHHGSVDHSIIDLVRRPGSYTFDLSDGKSYSVPGKEFKNRLSRMGTPLRLR